MAPRILVTNDDGIDSPGLHAAVASVRELGDVVVAAPPTQQTAMGRSYPKGPEVGAIRRHSLAPPLDDIEAFTIAGSPALVVTHAILELLAGDVDLCVSGVNYGENLGRTLLGSGTVGAALEAAAYGVPALAVSVEASIEDHLSTRFRPLDWDCANEVTNTLAVHLLSSGLPGDIAALNVNIPNDVPRHVETRVTFQSQLNYIEFEPPGPRNLAEPHQIRHYVNFDPVDAEPGSDVHAVRVDRVVSITPIGLLLTPNAAWTPPTDRRYRDSVAQPEP